jgi:hypothetical protein
MEVSMTPAAGEGAVRQHGSDATTDEFSTCAGNEASKWAKVFRKSGATTE